MSRRLLSAAAVIAIWSHTVSPVPGQERPAEVIAAHIRVQGYPCDRPKSARHDADLSKPNEQVWILECANATYRVTLVPDLKAKVERLN
jgi:hypothetical protein